MGSEGRRGREKRRGEEMKGGWNGRMGRGREERREGGGGEGR